MKPHDADGLRTVGTWLLLFLGLTLVAIGLWFPVRSVTEESCNPKIVNNKIDVLCPGQSVTVAIGADGTLRIVEPKK